jgi:diaminohydroxyphosphoribosylaminopyrimidine deaminase/5-amino-6-(5-phosphoribosylamino)uracil reductase
MAHALDLAQRGWGRVSPNPLVGAVILKEGEVVGEGWHAEFGGPHAERMALVQAGERARGATIVVTLEPCAHYGKQPPCVEALLEAGIARVVCAMRDPNPEATGGGVELELMGVDVQWGMMEEEARRLNAPFTHRFSDSDRPWVALKLATSKEGWIAPAGGVRQQLSGPEAQEWVHRLRAGFDAIGVGGATAIADDPSLTVRGEVEPRVPPVRLVFSGKSQVPPTLKLLTDGGPPSFVVGVRDLPKVLHEMKSSGNIGSLLVEGGGRLAAALVTAGLVDRFYWIQTPVELGPEGIPAFAGLPGAPDRLPGEWVQTERKSLGQDTLQVIERV